MRLRVRVYAPALSLMAPCLVRCAGGIIISITVVIVIIISDLVVFILISLWDDSWTTFRQTWNNLEATLVQFWYNVGTTLGTNLGPHVQYLKGNFVSKFPGPWSIRTRRTCAGDQSKFGGTKKLVENLLALGGEGTRVSSWPSNVGDNSSIST